MLHIANFQIRNILVKKIRLSYVFLHCHNIYYRRRGQHRKWPAIYPSLYGGALSRRYMKMSLGYTGILPLPE